MFVNYFPNEESRAMNLGMHFGMREKHRSSAKGAHNVLNIYSFCDENWMLELAILQFIDFNWPSSCHDIFFIWYLSVRHCKQQNLIIDEKR